MLNKCTIKNTIIIQCDGHLRWSNIWYINKSISTDAYKWIKSMWRKKNSKINSFEMLCLAVANGCLCDSSKIIACKHTRENWLFNINWCKQFFFLVKCNQCKKNRPFDVFYLLQSIKSVCYELCKIKLKIRWLYNIYTVSRKWTNEQRE